MSGSWMLKTLVFVSVNSSSVLPKAMCGAALHSEPHGRSQPEAARGLTCEYPGPDILLNHSHEPADRCVRYEVLSSTACHSFFARRTRGCRLAALA